MPSGWGATAAKLERRIFLDLPDAPVWIVADDTLLSQAVMNVASNCLRYAKTAVRISLTREQRHAVIRITDDGEGVPADDLPHIFERFYKGKGGNFGLGLAIAHSASFMGGGITARNSGSGAVFELKFPLSGEK